MQTTAASRFVRPIPPGMPFHRKVMLFAAAMTLALCVTWALGANALLDYHVSREPDPALAERAAELGRRILWGGFAVIVLLVGVGMMILERLIDRWVAAPARALAIAAEAVAAGDLTTTVREGGIDDVGRMSRATIVMIAELRRLAGALNGSSADTTRLAEEISAAAEQLAAGAGEMASTAGDLSEQSVTMAASITAITGASDRLATVAAELDRGAHEAGDRNRQLRTLSLENRARLDESSAALDSLSQEAAAGVKSVESLVEASEEVRSFVTLVRKLARQSKLLALNAAMEAARAGDEGEGFAVVANEVRRLAAMSSDAAERTEQVVATVLRQVEATRAWSVRTEATVRQVSDVTATGARSFVASPTVRTEATVRQVSDVTATGARSFAEIETTVNDLDAWAGTIESSAGVASQLTQDITTQLAALSLGTDTFASAMEQVAASSQEQSAATEEVAAAAAHLTEAASRLAEVVGNLKVADPAGADSRPAHTDARSGGTFGAERAPALRFQPSPT